MILTKYFGFMFSLVVLIKHSTEKCKKWLLGILQLKSTCIKDTCTSSESEINITHFSQWQIVSVKMKSFHERKVF